ncbi:MAG TPA: DUF4173 domain-containing protein [Longimicrobiales bacterium]|nr:DUF4173 domain-containing protein [Longimicrobiales bacterium]
MTDNARRSAVALVAAVDLGVLADLLLRAPGAPGLNFGLWMLGVAAALAWVAGTRGVLSREAWALVGTALVFAMLPAWRDAGPLKLLDLLVVAVLVGLAAYRGGRPWLRGAGVGDYAGAAAAAGLSGAFGTLLLAGEVDWKGGAGAVSASPWSRVGLAALRGVGLALPFLVVFGGLLMAADAVYARLVTNALHIDFGRVVSHVFLIGFFGWASGGWLREVLAGAPVPADLRRIAPARPRLGIVEVAVVLALLDALFASFMAVQVRYFFGGSAMVDVTPGLTYAEYARRGFFELVWVAALALPLLLAADWALARGRRADEWIFRGLAGLTVLLLFAILGSALQRMRLYQAAFGLTELRLYTTAFMAWIGTILLWFSATVLRGRRSSFALGALVSGVATVAALNVLSPDALIVRTNVARAASGVPFDGHYASRLGAEAVPGIVAALDRVPTEGRCAVAVGLSRRWGPKAPADWRSWSWGAWRARQAVRHSGLAREAEACAAAARRPA